MKYFIALCCAFIGALSAAAEYPAVVPGYGLEFPRDEASHPQFRTEWWYVTGWLEDETGAPMGFQVTFFRTRPGLDEDNPSRFALQQVLFAHVAISDPRRGKLVRDERSARAGFGLAEASTQVLDVVIDDWSLRRSVTAAGTQYDTRIDADGLALQLTLVATQPPLLQGDRGFSQKSPDAAAASYYYSLPHLRASGRVSIGELQYKVHGSAWMDHEWSTAYLTPQLQGWDWLSVNLDDGGALMASRIRDPQGNAVWAIGAVREADGATTSFKPREVEWTAVRRWRSPRTGIEYPVEWRVRAGERTLTLRPLMDDQENDSRASTGTLYYEGAVRAYDAAGRPVGRGYLELTGYAERVRF